MERINERGCRLTEEPPMNDLYTRFHFTFDNLLSLEDMDNATGLGERTYVDDLDFDNQTKPVFDDINDSFSVVIGYAGVGKSTSLRHTFGYQFSEPNYLPNSDSVLIFPANYNGNLAENDSSEVSALEDLRSRVEGVCDFIRSENEALNARYVSERGQKELYNYIEKTNRRALQVLTYEEDITLSQKEQRVVKLSRARENDSLVFAATTLKYLLGCKECGIRKLIVILDDIEPLSYEEQKSLVMQYGRFFKCMKNRCVSIEEKPFVVNLVISMRPYTYRELNKEEAFKVFSITRTIYKRNMVDFSELMDKKIAYYSDRTPHENKESWDEACMVLKRLTGKFDGKYSRMVKNLSIWNTRDAVSLFKKVLTNRFWIQRNMDKSSGFSISEDDYILNNITVLRAISCGEDYVYKDSEENPVPCVFQNKRNGDDYTFWILSVMRCFGSENEYLFTYGSKPKRVSDVVEKYERIFWDFPDCHEKVVWAIKFLYKRNILLKGINDTEKERELNKNNLLHLSPKGKELVEMGKSDSVYLELCRENFYRDYESNREDGKKNSALSSYEHMKQSDQIGLFIDLLRMLEDFLNEELAIVKRVRESGTLAEYINSFGDTSIGATFNIGICNSVRYSGNEWFINVTEERRSVDRRIAEIEAILHDGERIIL